MTLDINRLSSPLTPLREPSGTATSGSEMGDLFTSRDTPQPSQRVLLTPQAQTLQQITQELQALPEIDENRVSVIRQAILDGQYRVDSESVAEKLLAFEGNLK